MRGVAAAAHPDQGGHAGVVPPIDQATLDQFHEFALTRHGIGHIQTSKLNLLWMALDLILQLIQDPVIEGSVVLELQCADGVCDPLKGIRDAVGIVIHRVDAPPVTGTVVVGTTDAVDDRVT